MGDVEHSVLMMGLWEEKFVSLFVSLSGLDVKVVVHHSWVMFERGKGRKFQNIG